MSSSRATRSFAHREALHFPAAGGIAASLENDELLFPAVFLDRDGTLMEDVDYCADPARVAVYPSVTDSLRRLKVRGFRLVVVTNQSGIGRGMFTEADFQRVQVELIHQLGGDGLLDAAYHCPDAPERATNRRKPDAGMILEAARAHRLDLPRSYMVGDSGRDVVAGQRAGLAANVLVLTGKGQEHRTRCQPDFTAATLSEAADWILHHAHTVQHHG